MATAGVRRVTACYAWRVFIRGTVPFLVAMGSLACGESNATSPNSGLNDGGVDPSQPEAEVVGDDSLPEDDTPMGDDSSSDDAVPGDDAPDDGGESDDDREVPSDDDGVSDDDGASGDDLPTCSEAVPSGGGGGSASPPDDDVDSDDDPPTDDDTPSENDASADAGVPNPDELLAAAYPGDVGMGDDPDVVWFEDFEEGSLGAIAERYEQARDNGRWELVSDTPSGSGFALEMRAGQGEEAVDLYKQLPDAEEWYVRWYARYEEGVPWHHSGMWFGGYNPSSAWPDPNAGLRPSGDDRFSIAIEPVWEGPRLDTYNYWMAMHSWMEEPINDDGTAYYGNPVIHRNDFTVDEGEWMCLEVHVRLNTDVASGAGAMLEVWKNDELVASFGEAGPLGYWIRDKFCPEGADGDECTNYPAPATDVLDLRFRNTTDLRLNAFWPQNYITEDASGTLGFDQMVVASRRVGCTR
jgi:hypothetical protein